MKEISGKFIQEVTERIELIKEHSNNEAIEELSNYVSQLGTPKVPLHSQGIPPPDDLDYSVSSISSSISIPDTSILDRLCLIQGKNKEIQRAATIAIRNFKNTSKDLLSISQVHSGNASIILNELETMKRNLNKAVFDEQANRENNLSRNPINIGPFDVDEVLNRIQEIQKEINDATQKLIDSEKLICRTEESNFLLEKRIKKIEETMSNVVAEGPNQNIGGMCLCYLF